MNPFFTCFFLKMGQLFIKPLDALDDNVVVDNLLPTTEKTWENKKCSLCGTLKGKLEKRNGAVIIINNNTYKIWLHDKHDCVKFDDTVVHANYDCLSNKNQGLSSPDIFSVYNKPNGKTGLGMFGNANVLSDLHSYMARLTIGTIYDSFVVLHKINTSDSTSDSTSDNTSNSTSNSTSDSTSNSTSDSTSGNSINTTINKMCVFNGLYHARHKIGVVLNGDTKIPDSVRWVVWYDSCGTNASSSSSSSSSSNSSNSSSSSNSNSSSTNNPTEIFERTLRKSATLTPTVAFLTSQPLIQKLQKLQKPIKYRKIKYLQGCFNICHIRHMPLPL